MTPAEQAAAAPFAFLTQRGWRPAGGGQWYRDSVWLSLSEAIAGELAAIEGAAAMLAEMEVGDAEQQEV